MPDSKHTASRQTDQQSRSVANHISPGAVAWPAVPAFEAGCNDYIKTVPISLKSKTIFTTGNGVVQGVFTIGYEPIGNEDEWMHNIPVHLLHIVKEMAGPAMQCGNFNDWDEVIEAAESSLDPDVKMEDSPQNQEDWTYSNGYWTDSISGMTYYPAKHSRGTTKAMLLNKDNEPVNDPQLLQKMKTKHEQEGIALEDIEKKERLKKGSETRKRIARPKEKETADSYINAKYKVVPNGGVAAFVDKIKDVPAGQISYYFVDGKLSFDLNKSENTVGEYKGIGYCMIYHLLKHLVPGNMQVQIKTFDSGKGTENLSAYYKEIGFDGNLKGLTEDIINACEIKIKELNQL